MSSVWLVVSHGNGPFVEDGFHVTEEAAVARAEAKGLEDQAAYEHAKQWLEVSLEEFLAIRDLPSRYVVQEVEDTEYEIHRDGVVPDAVWLLIEEGQVDAERGTASPVRALRISSSPVTLRRTSTGRTRSSATKRTSPSWSSTVTGGTTASFASSATTCACSPSARVCGLWSSRRGSCQGPRFPSR